MIRRFAWTRGSIERLTWLSLEGVDLRAIAAELGCEERTARKMQIELNLATRMSKQPWTRKDNVILRALYPHEATARIAALLSRTVSQVYQHAGHLGLEKTPEYMASPAACRLRRGGEEHPGRATQFTKGHVPANKGLRRPGWAPGRMRETQFRKGERRGAANSNWKPIGTVMPDSEGFMRMKARELSAEDRATGFGNREVWQYVHRLTWEEHNGPIPAGHIVCFKDGNRANCTIDNLELVSRADLMRRNTIHNLPPELKGTIMLLGAVKRKLRDRDAKEHDDGSAQPSFRGDGAAQG